MININDVIVPTKGTAKYLLIKTNSFELSPSNGIKLTWSIHKEDIVLDPSEDAEEGDTISVAGKALLSGTLDYPQSEYNSWGTDDTVVTDWVMTELGFTEVT